jgi:uncharacterized membrane protein YgcG
VLPSQIAMLARERYLAEGQLVPRRLELRINAQVMLLRNIQGVGVNGSRGILIRMSKASNEYVRLVSHFEKVRPSVLLTFLTRCGTDVAPPSAAQVVASHGAASPLAAQCHRRILELVEHTSEGMGQLGTMPSLEDVLSRPPAPPGAHNPIFSGGYGRAAARPVPPRPPGSPGAAAAAAAAHTGGGAGSSSASSSSTGSSCGASAGGGGGSRSPAALPPTLDPPAATGSSVACSQGGGPGGPPPPPHAQLAHVASKIVYLSGRVDDRLPPTLFDVSNVRDFVGSPVVFVPPPPPPAPPPPPESPFRAASQLQRSAAVGTRGFGLPRSQQPPPLPPYPESQDADGSGSDIDSSMLRPLAQSRREYKPPAAGVIYDLASSSDDDDVVAQPVPRRTGVDPARSRPPVHPVTTSLPPRGAAAAASRSTSSSWAPPSVAHGASPLRAAAASPCIVHGSSSQSPSRDAWAATATEDSPRYSAAGRPVQMIDRSRFPPEYTIQWHLDPLTGEALIYPVVRFANAPTPVGPAAAVAAPQRGVASDAAAGAEDRAAREHMIDPVEFTMHIPGVGDCVLRQVPLKLAWAIR